MTTSLLPPGKQQYFTTAGDPLVGGKIYTYAAGTSTPKVTYQDEGATTPNTNPIILDSRGEATVFWDGSYKITLKDSLDNLIWTVDNITDPLTGSAAQVTQFRTDLSNTTDVTKGDALVGVKRTVSGAIATTQHELNERAVLSVFDFMTAAQIADTQLATPLLDHTGPWAAWSAAVEASKSRRGYIPGGTYNIDSWTVSARGVSISGASRSSVSLTNGVKIKARTAVTNFVTWESSDSYLEFIEIDGNNFATNVLKTSAQTFDFAFEAIYVGGAVNNGVNVNLSGATTNTQVAEGTFRDCFFFGSGSRSGSGATGITNVKINSNQSLVLSFHRCKFTGNDVNGTDVLEQVNVPLGTCSFFGCFWTTGNASGHDVRIGNGTPTGGGSVGLYDCRSESTLSDSIYVDGGAGDVVLTNFVHATSSKTSITLTANFDGRCTVVGGQQYNVTNSSSSAQVVLLNTKTLAGGSIGGAFADRIVRTIDSISISARRASKQATVAYSASITLAANQYDRHFILVSDGSPFTINAPTGPTAHQTIYIDIRNGHSGAMGAITWNSVFKLAGAFTNPATGKRRRIQFTYDGTNWIEDNRTAADGDV